MTKARTREAMMLNPICRNPDHIYKCIVSMKKEHELDNQDWIIYCVII